MTKEQLRQVYRQKRQEIHAHRKLQLDDLLLIRFQQLAFEHISVLMTYWPMANQAEPNTHLFTGYLRHMIPGLHITYPVADFSASTMHATLINEDTVYHTNIYGITEPANGEPVDQELIDIVFVPMLICDEQGYRVGYGKGFYDRFLAGCREDVLKIGFSYFEPVKNIDDTQSFDVPLNYCITPETIYEF